MGPTSCLKKCCAWPIIIIYNSPSGKRNGKSLNLILTILSFDLF